MPASLLGAILAMATGPYRYVGRNICVHQIPPLKKIHLACAVSALGVLRIAIEKKINIDLRELIQQRLSLYAKKIINSETEQQVLTFILERLKPWCQDQGIFI